MLTSDQVRLAEAFNTTRPRRKDYAHRDVWELAMQLWLHGLRSTSERLFGDPADAADRSEFASRSGYHVLPLV
jgi:hypothetical protein